MNNFISNLFNLCIVPFKDNTIFVYVAGILSCVWLFKTVYRMIRGIY